MMNLFREVEPSSYNFVRKWAGIAEADFCFQNFSAPRRLMITSRGSTKQQVPNYYYLSLLHVHSSSEIEMVEHFVFKIF